LEQVKKILTYLLLTAGAIFIVFFLLAFTSAPFWIWYGLGTAKAGITTEPGYIVLLGGSGIPSETGLMRCWYTAEAAKQFPFAKVIVALPGDTADSLSSVNRMKTELILRGVARERILIEDSGTNTRAQALRILAMTPPFMGRGPGGGVLLVTSPEHLYRAVLTFEKAGFQNVSGIPAFESDVESDFSFSARKLGGRKWVPDVGENITLRYRFWTQLHYEILILREYMAIAYYRVMGWI
jgi:uncharacterized SAM-binding protein YcdF (DUF218 family)